jgi:hypothetical protein
MSQLAPYLPLPADVEAAMAKLNTADAFDAQAFAIVDRERWKRGLTFIAIIVPLFGAYVALIWLLDALITAVVLPTFVFGFGAFLLAIITHSALLRDTMKDDMRVGEAIGRWEEKGRRIRETPLERKP